MRTRSETAQVQGGRVVPAHAVEQLGQCGGGAGGDEEVGAAVRGGGDRADRQAHALQPARAWRPAASATSITSNARPTGSISEAPGNSDHTAVTSSSGAPARITGAWSSGCAPGARQPALPQEQTPAAARTPGTTSQPHSPVYSAATVPSEERLRRREPDRMSRMPRLMPIVKPMPPPTGPTQRRLRSEREK
ncbi:hypothetical protein GCM10023238_18060 [Streptomyces heliomycini]